MLTPRPLARTPRSCAPASALAGPRSAASSVAYHYESAFNGVAAQLTVKQADVLAKDLGPAPVQEHDAHGGHLVRPVPGPDRQQGRLELQSNFSRRERRRRRLPRSAHRHRLLPSSALSTRGRTNGGRSTRSRTAPVSPVTTTRSLSNKGHRRPSAPTPTCRPEGPGEFHSPCGDFEHRLHRGQPGQAHAVAHGIARGHLEGAAARISVYKAPVREHASHTRWLRRHRRGHRPGDQRRRRRHQLLGSVTTSTASVPRSSRSSTPVAGVFVSASWLGRVRRPSTPCRGATVAAGSFDRQWQSL